MLIEKAIPATLTRIGVRMPKATTVAATCFSSHSSVCYGIRKGASCALAFPIGYSKRYLSTTNRNCNNDIKHPVSATLSPSSPSSSTQPTSTFTFLIGYAFAGKPRYDSETTSSSSNSDDGKTTPPAAIGFASDSPIGRWRDSLLRGGESGEDSLLCTPMGVSDDMCIGVSDGVGGWTESGIDPSLFSQTLGYHATLAAQSSFAHPDRIVTNRQLRHLSPQSILSHAFDAVLKEPLIEAGSATACILTLDSTRGVLSAANLGDSGFVILRPSSFSSSSSSSSSASSEEETSTGLHYFSPPQTFGFNTPLQLAKLPIELQREGSISNTPRDAALYSTTLRHGDLIIVATDGLLDNVDAYLELAPFAKYIKEKHHSNYNNSSERKEEKRTTSSKDSLDEDREFVQVLANNLLEYTKICQNSTTKSSPFQREAAKFGIRFRGGKVDDIALVCCLVIQRQPKKPSTVPYVVM